MPSGDVHTTGVNRCCGSILKMQRVHLCITRFLTDGSRWLVMQFTSRSTKSSGTASILTKGKFNSTWLYIRC